MKHLIVALTAAGLLLASAPAWAGGYGYGYKHGYSHYGYRHHGHGHGHGAIVVGALVGGLILGHLLTRPAYAAPRYYAPPPPRLVLGGCRSTTGTGYLNGRPALFGGTMCYDQYRRGYVTPGSQYFIGYLQ